MFSKLLRSLNIKGLGPTAATKIACKFGCIDGLLLHFQQGCLISEVVAINGLGLKTAKELNNWLFLGGDEILRKFQEHGLDPIEPNSWVGALASLELK